MKKIDNRGFTLVELLAIIVITALVLGIGTYSVVRLVNSSKNSATLVSTNSIKESASIYSDEDSNRWIEQYGDNYSYFCVTVEELINKGIIKKNATLPTGIEKSNYVSVKKDRVTLVKGEAVILDNDNKNTTEYKVCYNTDIKSENVTVPSLGDGKSYTDGLSISFINGEADSGIKDRWCQYNTKSSFKEGENVIVVGSDGKCNIDNLKDDSTYYVRGCMTTNGGSRACSDTTGYKTAKFKDPTFSYKDDTIMITYNNDDNIRNNQGKYYFKSNVSGNSSSDVYECDDNFNCNSTTKSISKDKWYRVINGNSATIDYSTSDGINDGVVTAKISDGSNYSDDFKSEFSLYKIVFKVGNASSISGSNSDITKKCLVSKGKSCNITSPTISKNCYTGMGWSTSNNANSSSWSPGSSKSVSSSGTYYPTNGNRITYTVSYNANGGSGAPSSQTKSCGSNLTLSSSKPSRSNYTFKGWSTSSSGSVSYSSGGTYSSDKSITLYAVWEKDSSSYVYAIYYQANGSGVSGLPSEQYKNPGVSLTLSSSKPSRSGYTFMGWSTSSSGSVEYSPGSKYYEDKSIYLYAVWKSNSSSGGGSSTKTYTVSYNANGGSGAPSSQIKYEGVSLTLSSSKPTKSGYTFKGWATSSSSSVVSYDPGDTYTSNRDIVLYAVWQSNSSSGGGSSTKTYTVSYNANGGSGAPSSQTKYEGVSLTLSSSIPTRSDYAFKGWATSSSSSTVSYYPGGTYTANSNITLYAVWGVKTYTIRYYGNGKNVTNVPAAQTKEHGKSIKLSTTVPVRSSYKFLGWSEDSSATSASYGSGGAIIGASVNRDMNLYAVWYDPVSVSYDAINAYRCANGNQYYITTCTDTVCNYNKMNGKSTSGTVSRNVLNACSVNYSVSGVSASICSGTTITLNCSATEGVAITYAEIVDNGDVTFGTTSAKAKLVSTRSGNISTTFTCTSYDITKSDTKYYKVISCSSGGSTCKSTVTCLGSGSTNDSYNYCKNIVTKAGGSYLRHNPYGDCYGTFCNTCPSGWTKS